MKRNVLIPVLLVFLLGSLLASVYAGRESSAPISNNAQGDGLTQVRVGAAPEIIFVPVFLADRWGYFEEEGIDVEIVARLSNVDLLAPLASGELDVVIGAIDAGLFNYAARNLDDNDDPGFRIVMAGHTEKPPVGSPLVVSSDRYNSGELTSVTDLSGGRVAIDATGAAAEYWMFRALEQGGLTFNDVELVTVAFPDVASALNSGGEDQIDAAILGEPMASIAESRGLIVRLSSDFVDEFQATYVYMSNDFLANDPEAARGFIRAMIRAYRRLQNPDTWRDADVIDYLSQLTGIGSEDLLEYYAFPNYEPDGEVMEDDLATLQDYFMEQERLDYEEPLDLDRLLDRREWEAVVQDLEQYATPEPGE